MDSDATIQERFPGQEFPGDDDTNYFDGVVFEDPSDFPRSPGKVLDELGHQFKVGINGFGRLGRSIFCKVYNMPYINIIAVNDPYVDAAQAATLLQREHSRLTLGTSLEIHAEATANKLQLKDTATGKTTTVQFSTQDDPSILGWASIGAFHIIECSGIFTTIASASAHLTRGFRDQPDADGRDGDGALKVLIAAPSPNAPRFYPGVNLREVRVEQNVIACAPPGDDYDDENDGWQYADHVLELLSLVLARDGAAASHAMVHEAGRASSLDTLFENSLYWILKDCLPSREPPAFHEGLLEIGNSEFMMASKCYCRGCRVPEGKED